MKITLLCILSALFVQAQEDYTYALKAVKKVVISTNTSVQLIAGDANELVIGKYDYQKGSTCDTNHNYNYNYNYNHNNHNEHENHKNDRSRGLKPIYAGGTDNTGFGFSVEKEGDVLKIKDLKSFTQRNGIKFTLPKTVDVSVNTGNLGGIRAEGFSSEIEIKSNVGHIHLEDVTGPITATTSTGAIDVSFVKVSQSQPISLRSSTGSVDVSLPEDTNADLVLKSTMGTVFTNFELDIETKEGMRPVNNHKIVSKLNDGGVKITLSSSTGNVYLRKKE